MRACEVDEDEDEDVWGGGGTCGGEVRGREGGVDGRGRSGRARAQTASHDITELGTYGIDPGTAQTQALDLSLCERECKCKEGYVFPPTWLIYNQT